MRYNKRKGPKLVIDGITFDSGHEADVYAGLKALHTCGQITKLQVHPEFRFIVNGIRIGKYTPDFVFHENGAVKVIDAKGFTKSPKTGKMLPRVDRDFRLRANLMKALFGLEVEIM